MAIVQHGSDAIKAESIKMKFVQPVLAVTQQEMDDIILTIVKAQAIPGRMLMAVTRIEKLVRITGKITQALDLILHGMRVDDIHNDGNALLMRGIDEGFQFLRSAKPARRSKERTHVIAKTTIVRMLLDGHDLHAVVAVFHDSRQYVVFKLCIGANFLGILSHTYMTFVDQQRIL